METGPVGLSVKQIITLILFILGLLLLYLILNKMLGVL